MTRSRPRMSADERMEQLVTAAVSAFAQSGYAGTTTDQVARLAGVTQPYVIRLFGTKEKLFLAALERVCTSIEQVFRDAAARQPDLGTLGESYESLLADRDLLLVFLHGFAASSEPAIGDLIRGRFDRICGVVRDLTGASALDIRMFMASGMLLTVLATMRVLGPDALPPGPALAELMNTFEMGEKTLPTDESPS
jgi:AcrR family transcriptional regulator